METYRSKLVVNGRKNSNNPRCWRYTVHSVWLTWLIAYPGATFSHFLVTDPWFLGRKRPSISVEAGPASRSRQWFNTWFKPNMVIPFFCASDNPSSGILLPFLAIRHKSWCGRWSRGWGTWLGDLKDALCLSFHSYLLPFLLPWLHCGRSLAAILQSRDQKAWGWAAKMVKTDPVMFLHNWSAQEHRPLVHLREIIHVHVSFVPLLDIQSMTYGKKHS